MMCLGHLWSKNQIIALSKVSIIACIPSFVFVVYSGAIIFKVCFCFYSYNFQNVPRYNSMGQAKLPSTFSKHQTDVVFCDLAFYIKTKGPKFQ
jgi:hypothetical protein